MGDGAVGEMANLIVDATGNDLTYRIIGAAMAVHNSLGYGYKEEVYERALAVELSRLSIPAERQFPIEIQHAGIPVAVFYLDIFVDQTVVVEVKAFPHQLTNDELGQVIGYLKATGAPIGLLLNFGRRRLEYRRVFPGPAAEGELPRRLGRDNVKRKTG
jgi:GxxExxY protein